MRKKIINLTSLIMGTMVFALCTNTGFVYAENNSGKTNDISSFVTSGPLQTSGVYFDYTIDSSVDKTGKTDVSRYLNDLLAKAAANGTEKKPSVVYIPDGTYLIGDSALVIGNNTVLHLSDNAVIKKSDKVGKNSSMIMSPRTNSGGYKSLKNVEIYGGTWNQNQSSGRTKCDNGEAINMTVFLFSHSEGINVHDTTVKNVRSEHAFIFDGCKNVSVKNVTFRDFFVPTDGDNIYAMEAIHFDITNAVGSAEEPLDDTPCVDVTVTGCVFNNVISGVGSHHSDAVLSTVNKNYNISNNTFEKLQGNAINASLVDGGTFTNNTLKSGAGDFFQAVSARNLVVDGNSVDGSRYGIYVDRGNHGSGDITIKNNTIKNTAQRGIHVGMDDSYVSGAEESVNINGNTVTSVKNYGIYVNGYKATIDNNSIDGVSHLTNDTVVKAENVSGIRLAYTTSGSIIKNNTIKNAAKGIGVYNSENVSVLGNNISAVSDSGIKAMGSGYTISDNMVDKAKNSIWLQYDVSNSKKNSIKNNVLSNSTNEGILLYVDDKNKSVASDNSVTVESNVITNSGDYGIKSKNYGAVSVINNKIASVSLSANSGISSAGVAGVKIEEARTMVKIKGNIVEDASVGLWASACSNVDISSNSTKFTNTNGIKISTGSSNISIDSNSITHSSNNTSNDNSMYAVLVADSETISITNNSIYSNGLYDITVWGPTSDSKTTIKGNLVNGDANSRIRCTSTNSELSGNEGLKVVEASSAEVRLENGTSILLSYAAEKKEDAIVWSSSDSSIAAVDQNGLVTALKEGKCTISISVNGTSVATNNIIVIPGSKKTENKDSDDDGKNATSVPTYKNEWVNGKWYDGNGNQTYEGTLEWKCNATGWWVEDTAGWYPTSQWQRIDGKWYYFLDSGYMDYSEYRDGCWLGSDGAWNEDYSGGHWCSNSSGWWYEDNAGWYPYSQWLWIDGTEYWFDESGYWN